MKAPLLKAKKPVSRLIDHHSDQGALSNTGKSFMPPPVVLSSSPAALPIQKKESHPQQSFFADSSNWHYFKQSSSQSKQNNSANHSSGSNGQPVVQGFFKKIGNAVKSGFKAVTGGITNVASKVGNTILNVGGNLVNNAGNFLGGVIGGAADFVRQGLSFVTEKTAPVVSFLQNMGGQVWDFVKNAGGKVRGFIEGVADLLPLGGGSAIIGLIQKYGAPLLNRLVGAGSGILNTLKEVVQLGAESARPILDLIFSGNAGLIDILKGTSAGVRNFIHGLKDMLVSKGKAFIGPLLNLGTDVLQAIVSKGGDVLTSVFNIINTHAPWITETLLRLISDGASFVNKLVQIGGHISGFLSNLINLGKDAGRAILEQIFKLPSSYLEQFIKLSMPVLSTFIDLAQKIGVPAIVAIQQLVRQVVQSGGDISSVLREVISIVQNFLISGAKGIASAIEGKLSSTIGVVISFLANTLGLKNIKQKVSKTANKAVNAAKTIGSKVKKGARKFFNTITGGKKKIGKAITSGAARVSKGAKNILIKGAKKIGKGARFVANVVKSGAKKTGKGAKAVIKTVKNVAKRVGKGAKNIFIKSAKKVGKGAVRAAKAISGGAKKLIAEGKKVAQNIALKILPSAKSIGKKMKSSGNPIEFAKQTGVLAKEGIQRFIRNLAQHLVNGLMPWLSNALDSIGLKMPEKFDFHGVLSIVMQILRITWKKCREWLKKLLGEKLISAGEKGIDFLKLVKGSGIAGIWKTIVNKTQKI